MSPTSSLLFLVCIAVIFVVATATTKYVVMPEASAAPVATAPKQQEASKQFIDYMSVNNENYMDQVRLERLEALESRLQRLVSLRQRDGTAQTIMDRTQQLEEIIQKLSAKVAKCNTAGNTAASKRIASLEKVIVRLQEKCPGPFPSANPEPIEQENFANGEVPTDANTLAPIVETTAPVVSVVSDPAPEVATEAAVAPTDAAPQQDLYPQTLPKLESEDFVPPRIPETEKCPRTMIIARATFGCPSVSLTGVSKVCPSGYVMGDVPINKKGCITGCPRCTPVNDDGSTAKVCARDYESARAVFGCPPDFSMNSCPSGYKIGPMPTDGETGCATGCKTCVRE